MSNGKKTAVSAETFENVLNRQKAVTSLLCLSSEEFIHDSGDRECTVSDSWGEICSGWNKICPTCTYEHKTNIKTKNKKILGNFRNINVTNPRYDRKKMRLLFSNNLKYMFTSENHEYIPSNGVYRTMKFAETNTDSSAYKKISLRKPSLLLPLNECNSFAKDMLAVSESNKSQNSSSDNYNCCPNYSRSKKNLASFTISDLSGLRIDGDYPHTMVRRSLKKSLFPKSKSADSSLKARDQFANVNDNNIKEMIVPKSSTNEKQQQQQLPRTKASFNDFSKQKPKQLHTLSVVQLKAMTQQQRIQDNNTQSNNTFNRLSCLNLAQPFYSISTQETFSVFKTKDQKSKKINKGLLFNEICKTFNQEQTYSDYNFGVKSTLDNRVQTSTSLGQDLLPEISGKRIQVCPTIHRWL